MDLQLPRGLYELLPYAYLTGGLALGVASYPYAEAGWANAALGLGAIGVVAGLVLILRRSSYRADAERYDQKSLDD